MRADQIILLFEIKPINLVDVMKSKQIQHNPKEKHDVRYHHFTRLYDNSI